VFEIISKWVKKKMNPYLQKYKGFLPADWVEEEEAVPAVPPVQPIPVTARPVPDKPVENAG
jgi:hypothetical protein